LPEKCPILHIVCPKKNFPGFFFGTGGATHFPLVSYAYGLAPGLPPAKSGPDFWMKLIEQKLEGLNYCMVKIA